MTIATLLVLAPLAAAAQPAGSTAPAAGSTATPPAAGSTATATPPAAGSDTPAATATPSTATPSTVTPSTATPSTATPPAAGSDAPAGSAAAPPASDSIAPAAAGLRKTCADAMNADPTFADAIVVATLKDQKWSWERIAAVDPTGASALLAQKVNADTLRQHQAAAHAIAKNEKHVVLAYGAFWVLAVGFVLFLWRRQQGLQSEIQQLKRDLEAAKQ